MRRALLAAAGLVLAAAGAWQAARPAALTLSNAGLGAAYPAPATWGAVAAAAGLVLVLAALPRGRWRLLPVLPALLFLLLAAERARFRVDVGREELVLGGLVGSEALAWKAVRSVELRGGDLLVRADGRELVVRLGPLSPAERPSLERAVARRVQEAQAPPEPAAPPAP